MISQFSLGSHHTLLLTASHDLFQTVLSTGEDQDPQTFQQITLRSSAEKPSAWRNHETAVRFLKITAKGMYSSVLIEGSRHYLVWSTHNIQAPILVMEGDVPL